MRHLFDFTDRFQDYSAILDDDGSIAIVGGEKGDDRYELEDYLIADEMGFPPPFGDWVFKGLKTVLSYLSVFTTRSGPEVIAELLLCEKEALEAALEALKHYAPESPDEDENAVWVLAKLLSKVRCAGSPLEVEIGQGVPEFFGGDNDDYEVLSMVNRTLSIAFDDVLEWEEEVRTWVWFNDVTMQLESEGDTERTGNWSWDQEGAAGSMGLRALIEFLGLEEQEKALDKEAVERAPIIYYPRSVLNGQFGVAHNDLDWEMVNKPEEKIVIVPYASESDAKYAVEMTNTLLALAAEDGRIEMMLVRRAGSWEKRQLAQDGMKELLIEGVWLPLREPEDDE